MKVRNLEGTAGKPCKCGSWLKHWEKFGKIRAIFCSTITCTILATVGAHVKKTEGVDTKEYIIPLCATCNMITAEDLVVADTTKFVSADPSETCEKKK